ncbi:MAG: transglycosylase domain-containing protein [Verrucomicrobia bacterium]|nr:transglycosylase domain-containing protein [Verrucomicrobiota bacterium]
MTEPERRRPFFFRPLFVNTVLILLLLAGVGGWFALDFIGRYEKKAAEFDLSKLDSVESASVIYDRYGQVFGKLFIQNREQVSLDQISPYLIEAVIAEEDNRFYEHSGVDFYGMFRALLKNTKAGRIRQGASTVTQQLARNVFDLRDRTYDRKILEVFLAMRIERSVPKNKIMELYLNRVYFGGGLYGAEAASKGYFGKPAKDLSVGEAAMLAALLKSPNNLSPWHNLEAATLERDFVLNRMVEEHKISQQTAEGAKRQPLQVQPKSGVVSQSYAIDLIRQQVQGEIGLESITSQGYRIYTTLDPVLQKTAEESLRRELTKVEEQPEYQHQTYAEYTNFLKTWKNTHAAPESPPVPEYLQGAVVAVDNRTGGLLALVGGRDFSQSEYDRAFQSKRPAGTAFTPLVFTAALEKGVFPGSLFEDAPLDNRQVMIGGTTGILGEWGVERADNQYEGPLPMRRVFALSKNAATVRVGVEAGLDSVLKLAKKAGIQDDLRPYPATFLGSSDVALADLVTSYMMFPGSGSRPERLMLVVKIETQDGQEIYHAEPQRVKVIEPGVAFEMHSFLTEVMQTGTASNARQEFGLRQFPAAGKTGTAYNFTDVWFVGYDSEVTCGVWAGFDKPQTIRRGAFSNQIALPVWTEIMNASLATQPPRELGRPIDLKRVEVCLDTGLPASPKCMLTSVADPWLPPRKGTFFEFSTAKQLPNETCWLHGDDTRSFVRTLRSQDAPRATNATDPAQSTPVLVRGPTVIGDDPYQSIKPRPKEPPQFAQTSKADWTPAPRALPVDKAQPEVRRAAPVGPLDRQQKPPPVDLPTPPPVDLNEDPTNL